MGPPQDPAPGPWMELGRRFKHESELGRGKRASRNDLPLEFTEFIRVLPVPACTLWRADAWAIACARGPLSS